MVTVCDTCRTVSCLNNGPRCPHNDLSQPTDMYLTTLAALDLEAPDHYVGRAFKRAGVTS